MRRVPPFRERLADKREKRPSKAASDHFKPFTPIWHIAP